MANIYVDQTLGGNCTSGNYSIASRNCSGSDGNAYTTIAGALAAMSSGDDIYLRGGTYTGAVTLTASTVPDGTSGNYCSIQSYAGEWAILDGEHSVETVLGRDRNGRDSGNDIQYWLFQRLEIKNGGDSYSATGLLVTGGYITVRYCYIHDNYTSNASGTNNPSGIMGYTWHNSIVEYCWFYNNGKDAGGVDNNCAHIQIFSDYIWTPRDLDDINESINSNIFRYNYLDNAYAGIKHKGPQFLGDDSGSDFTYEEYGDQIHHNILVNITQYAIQAGQDFCQIHNNILDSGRLTDEEIGTDFEEVMNTTIYNNTVVDSFIVHPVGIGFDITTAHPYTTVVSNIVEANTESYESFKDINILPFLHATDPTTFESTDLTLDYNLIHDPSNADHMRLGWVDTTDGGYYTTSEFNTEYSTTNYTNTTSGLFLDTVGSDQYVTDGTFVVTGSTTIADGGSGAAHPFLSGVTLPDYVGATNPDDYAWVDGVYNDVTDWTWLRDQVDGSDPSWVEGTGGTSFTTSVDALTLTEYSATISLPTVFTTTVDALTLTAYTATISAGISILATTDALTLTEYPSTVTTGNSILATTDSLTLTTYNATIGYDVAQAGSGGIEEDKIQIHYKALELAIKEYYGITELH